MPYGLIDYNTLNNIAKAIRYKANSNAQYYPRDFATAINTIKTGGGGFNEPVITTLYKFRPLDYYGNFNNAMINFREMAIFETTNNIPYSEPSFVNFGSENYPELSPAEVTFYKYFSSNYKITITPESNFIGYINIPLYGDWSNNNPVYANGVETYAKTGDVVVESGGGILFRWDGSTWKNLHITRSRLNNLWSENNNVYGTAVGYVYGLGVDNSWNGQDISVLDLSSIFSFSMNNYVLPEAYCGKYTRSMYYAYHNCYQAWFRPVCGNLVDNLSHAYHNCGYLSGPAVCGPNVTDMSYAYYACNYGSLNQGAIGSKVTNISYAYYYDGNIRTITGDANNVIDGSGAFYECNNMISYPRNMYSLINGNNMFVNAAKIGYFPNCPNLVDGACMFRSGDYGRNNSFWNLSDIENYIFNLPNLRKMGRMFSFGANPSGPNILNLNYPSWVEDISYMYSDNSNYHEYDETNNTYVLKSWFNNTEPICPDTVKYINGIYESTNVIGNAACGNNVLFMDNAYTWCSNLTGAACGPNVIGMNYAYTWCSNLTGEAACGDNVIYFNYAYTGTKVQTANCGNNVIFMQNTYTGCNYLTGDAACGPNVRYMPWAYDNCLNLNGNAACGDNVINMLRAYNNCTNLVNAACGNNVTEMQYAYYNCTNLLTAVCGPNVVNMGYAYYNCQNLTDAYIGPSVMRAESAFYNCINLQNAIVLGNFAYRSSSTSESPSSAFYNCRNLRNVQLGETVEALPSTFRNCTNLETISLPNNITFLSHAFMDCVNLSCDIVLPCERLNYLLNAFYNCNNIQNIYIAGGNFANYAYKGVLNNAFYRTNYSLRRNVVIGNYLAWVNLINISYNTFGYFGKTNETYSEPVEVNVNGITYNTVRCAYNTTYNCYIYCME